MFGYLKIVSNKKAATKTSNILLIAVKEGNNEDAPSVNSNDNLSLNLF